MSETHTSAVEPPSLGSSAASRVLLADLTQHSVATLLRNNGFGRYEEICVRTPLTGRDLAHCRESDLEECGITFRPHRLSILQLVQTWTANGVAADELVSLDDRTDSLAEDEAEPAWLAEARESLGRSALVAERGEAALPPTDAASEAPPAAVSDRHRARLQALADAVDARQGGMGTVALPKHPKPSRPAATAHAILEVHYAADRGTIRVLSGERPYVLGRAAGRVTAGAEAELEVDLALREAHISSVQAVLVPPDPPGRSWSLVDLSKNGTFVNGDLVGKGSTITMHPGDCLQFGKLGSFPSATFQLPTAAHEGVGNEAGLASPVQLSLDCGASTPPASWSCGAWECADPG
jgi:hypothetical protein